MHFPAMICSHTNGLSAALALRMALARRANPAGAVPTRPLTPRVRWSIRSHSSDAAATTSRATLASAPSPIAVSLAPNRPCTLVFSLKDPDSEALPQRQHAQLKVLLPMSSPIVSAIDLVSALRSEVAGDLKVTRGISEHVVTDTKLDQMTVWQFLHSNSVCWLRGAPYSVDPTGLISSVQQLRASLTDMEKAAKAGSDKLAMVDARVRKQLDWIVHGGTAFLWAELTTIIYLTNELGWDLMEPTSYLLGLTTVTLGSAFFTFIGREFTYNNMTASLESWLTRRLVSKEHIDIDQIQEAVRAAARTRQQLDPLLASIPQDTTVSRAQ
ncbi:hypothetical protein BCR44DRAFT_1481755 [Catenaria anguillulae PL171]|uniref:Calcium uniporter protein, mitochondrial n=1 Tax=Catenaria anguillulae PL171 TaxID=765915 RepID=A0A1Y2I1A1_9FUNG|nr:hypothetical protein BCR44DRAFT_1481755 [Catenaria anguillulae PL171]